MSLSRFLKSAGILEDDKPAEVPNPKLPAAGTTRGTAASTPASDHASNMERLETASMTDLLDGTDGPKLDMAGIEAAIEEHIRGLPEFALFASFQKQVDAMKGVIGDERTRFMAAQATTNLSCADLCKSVEAYSTVLAGEAEKFNTVYVANEQAHISQCNDLVVSLQKEIDDLTSKLGELAQRKSDHAAHIIASTALLEKAKIDFGSIMSTVSGRYEETLKKLHQHLGL